MIFYLSFYYLFTIVYTCTIDKPFAHVTYNFIKSLCDIEKLHGDNTTIEDLHEGRRKGRWGACLASWRYATYN